MRYSLRACSTDDEAFVRRIHHEAYLDVVTRQFGRWDEAEQDGFFAEKWDSRHYQQVVVEGAPVGVLRLTRDADQLFIDEMQLLPEFQGRGIGTQVLADLLADSRRAKLPVRLRVLRLNRAKSLYERLGFTVYDETGTHFLMEWLPRKRTEGGLSTESILRHIHADRR